MHTDLYTICYGYVVFKKEHFPFTVVGIYTYIYSKTLMGIGIIGRLSTVDKTMQWLDNRQ